MADHEHRYASCERCGMYCYECGAPWPLPTSQATFTVSRWPHERHLADLAGAHYGDR